MYESKGILHCPLALLFLDSNSAALANSAKRSSFAFCLQTTSFPVKILFSANRLFKDGLDLFNGSLMGQFNLKPSPPLLFRANLIEDCVHSSIRGWVIPLLVLRGGSKHPSSKNHTNIYNKQVILNNNHKQ